MELVAVSTGRLTAILEEPLVEEAGGREQSGEDRLHEKRQSTSEGEQGSCPRSEDTKPLRVQPLRGRRPDMRRTRRARPRRATLAKRHLKQRAWNLLRNVLFSSPDGRRGNRPLPMAGFDGGSVEEQLRLLLESAKRWSHCWRRRFWWNGALGRLV